MGNHYRNWLLTFFLITEETRSEKNDIEQLPPLTRSLKGILRGKRLS